MIARTVPSRAPSRTSNATRIHLVQSILTKVPATLDPIPQSLLQRRILNPLAAVLQIGCSPRRLAWSISIGLVLGINPLLGSTTLVSLAVAGLFRLNLVASQLATHLAYPIEIALFFVFIRLGNRIFHTGHLPLHREALLAAVRYHPWETTKLLWTWEWHALIVWAIVALILAPVLAALLTPILRRLNQSPTRLELVK